MSEITDLHEPFMRFLREQKLEFIRARSDKASTISKGWPDFTIVHPRRPALIIEFKQEKRRIDPAQTEVHERLKARGFAVHVVRDIGVALNLVMAWLSDVRQEPAPNQMQRPYIRLVPGAGDFIHDANGKILRRATIADLSEYERKP